MAPSYISTLPVSDVDSYRTLIEREYAKYTMCAKESPSGIVT